RRPWRPVGRDGPPGAAVSVTFVMETDPFSAAVDCPRLSVREGTGVPPRRRLVVQGSGGGISSDMENCRTFITALHRSRPPPEAGPGPRPRTSRPPRAVRVRALQCAPAIPAVA